MKSEPVPDSFWSEAIGSGLLHRADVNSPAFCPDLLFVYIHGIGGDKAETWGEFPESVLKQLKLDADVFSFGFNSKPYHSISVGVAADELWSELRNHFSDRRHLVFIVHSTGGLIIRDMLRKCVKPTLQRFDSNQMAPADAPQLALCIRSIIYLDTPHLGGELLLSWGAALLYLPLALVLGPLLYVFGLLRRSKQNYGVNYIVFQLMSRNSWLKRLRKDHKNVLVELEKRGLPGPHEFEILARVRTTIATDPNDYSAVPGANGGIDKLGAAGLPLTTVPSDHTGMKRIQIGGTSGEDVDRLRGGPARARIVEDVGTGRICAVLLRKYRRTPAHIVCERTIHRLLTNNKNRVIFLLRDPDIGEGGDGKYSQAGCYDELTRRISQSDRVQRLVVTGGLGVGKTAVLRYALRELARESLRSATEMPILPLYYTLKEADIQSNWRQPASTRDGMTLWLKLVDSFASKFSAFAGVPGLIASSWIDQELRRRPAVLFLDGIDEFLMVNPTLDLVDVRKMLDALVTRYGENRRLTIICGVRSTTPDIQMLADNRRSIFYLRAQSRSEIESLYPGMVSVFARVEDDKSRGLLCNPLVAADVSVVQNAPRHISTSAEVLALALRARIENSPLVTDVLDDDGERIPYERWLAALIFIAWRFYENFRGNIDLATLAKEATAALPMWRDLRECTRRTAESVWLYEGIELVRDERKLDALISSSIFELALDARESSRYRIEHQEYLDYLAAYFLAYCIWHDRFAAYGSRGFLPNNLRLAGQVLMAKNGEVDENTIDLAACATQKLNQRFILGNLGAMLGYSPVPMTGPAVMRLFNELAPSKPNVNPALRQALLGGLIARAWSAAASRDTEKATPRDGDTSAQDILLVAYERLPEFLSRPDHVNPVTRSMVWCYCKVLAGLNKMPALETPWPKPIMNDEFLDCALVIVDESPDGSIGNDSRAFQHAFLSVQEIAIHDHYRRIAAIHYMISLVATVVHSRHLPIVGSEVRRLLGPGSDYERAMRDVPELPELVQIIQMLREKLPH